mmetsp:Transcript_29785/g.81695  ORF Transcript_29785/g.81695 Transcript_29785/m.81695 type:complete len:279 (-) Transcript_29785:77-913(-)
MKIILKYEESDDKALHLTLRLTLPEKYVKGPTSAVVKLFVDHYNKKLKDSAIALDETAMHIKVVGGEHLDPEAKVAETLRGGDECYIMGKEALERQSMKRDVPVKKAEPASAPAPSKAPATDEQGRLRCKRFGCQKFYHPDGPPQECIHHKAAPIFHETAKWWSCCPDRKAYDWDEFMRIPGCATGFCSNTVEGQDGKRFYGGMDLRSSTAPVRLDADAPKDPQRKLADLRKGLVAVGVDGALFENVVKRLAADTQDLELVCAKLKTRFAAILNRAGA